MSERRFVPERLTSARKRRGLTKIALADAVGVSSRMVTDYEAGRAKPTPSTLDAIAEALKFPAEWFARPDLPEIGVRTATFRALSKLTAGQRASAVSAGTIAVELSDWFEGRFDLPPVALPANISNVDPATTAEIVRNEWGVGQRPISNMLDLLEVHGIRVFSLVEQCQEVDAFSWWYKNTPFVFLNTLKSAERSRFDAAHELGHLVLHRDHTAAVGREAERQADQFAAAFLMPRDDVLSLVPPSPSLNQLVQLKSRWKVSVAALAHRSHELGLLSDWLYRSICIEIRTNGFHRKEPNEISRERSQTLGQILSQLRSDGVGPGAIADAMCVNPSEINELLFGLAIVGVDGLPGSDESGRERVRPDLRLVR